MRVIVADRLPDTHVAALGDRYDLRYEPSATDETLVDLLPGYDVLVVRSTKVTEDAIAAGDTLRYILRAGAGTDTIDRAAAGRQGIAVCNLPGRNAAAVAELAVGLLLSIDRRLPEQVADLRSGRWRKGHYAKLAQGIAGRDVGVVGLGQIGLAFAERVAAFGAQIHAVGGRDRDAERQRRAEAIGVRFVESLDELASSCDVLSFHLPAAETTRGIIGRALLEQVRPGTILLNTSRGDLIDAPALLAALDDKELYAGLDVYPDEPSDPEAAIDLDLAKHPRVHGTHHVGASTQQAQRAVADGVLESLVAFEEGARPNCVNEDQLPRSGA